MASDYQPFLAVATHAALDAGALLRQEFLKPGGPSGLDPHHAVADTHAEELIRARLAAAAPEWGYRGEETAPHGTARGGYLWLVDPNDGTAPYLKGFRGSAVSIALLREGLPILGVVYAFAAPDNRGDLITWAEGCGPLQRNGVAIQRPEWHGELSPRTVVILSHAADYVPAPNLVCVAPARYRAAPSIAYRLALAAAGDGEAAVSLSGAGGWDYAAGHALLRGVGGALVDEHGAAVTYTRDGASRTAWCFGGSPGLVAILAKRPWRSVLVPGANPRPPLDLSWPSPGATIPDSDLLERAQGCLLGQLAGDALGSMAEFMGAEDIRRAYPAGLREIGPSPVFDTLAGQPTDDSELALALARALVRGGSYDAERVAAAYAYWRTSGPFDIGHTIGAATDAMARAELAGTSLVAAAERTASHASEANGALMRQSPLAIWGHALEAETLAEYVRADTRLTHPNPVCQDASAAFIVALAAVIREGLRAEAAFERARAWHAAHGGSPTVGDALAAAAEHPPHYERSQGHVLIAIQNAFYQALHAPTLEDGLVTTVMAGGDTDTNAAIAGALLGALAGAHAIPAQWRQALLSCRPQADAPGVHTPRPRAFWPVDALILAERLLVAGLEQAGGGGA